LICTSATYLFDLYIKSLINLKIFGSTFKTAGKFSPCPPGYAPALSSLSIKPLISCVTDFVLQLNETCQLNCVKTSCAAPQQNRRSGFCSFKRKSWNSLV